MALKATIFKADLQIADMDRGHYADYSLTLARHPSETDERMMVRLAAFALCADESLAFGAGLSSEVEPALWRRDLTGRIQMWIEVGLPDEKSVRKACGRAREVLVYAYGRGADMWWRQAGEELARHENLSVWALPIEATHTLATLADRSMRLQFTIQEAVVFATDDKQSVQLEPQLLKRPKP